jgi:hypothetical protein
MDLVNDLLKHYYAFAKHLPYFGVRIGRFLLRFAKKLTQSNWGARYSCFNIINAGLVSKLKVVCSTNPSECVNRSLNQNFREHGYKV